jgi:hypothetical protein
MTDDTVPVRLNWVNAWIVGIRNLARIARHWQVANLVT